MPELLFVAVALIVEAAVEATLIFTVVVVESVIRQEIGTVTLPFVLAPMSAELACPD